MKYTSLTMAAAFGNAMASASSPHGGGGSSSIHPKRMDVGAISFGNHQGPVVMKEAAIFGGVDGNSSAGGNSGGGSGGLELVTARTQDHLVGGGGYGHRGSAMVDVAVEEGGISEGDAYGGKVFRREGLGLATEDRSGVVAKPNTLGVVLVGGNVGWKGDSDSGVKDVSSLAGHDVVDIHESSGGGSGVFAVVSWQDSVQVTANSRRDGVVSLEALNDTCTKTDTKGMPKKFLASFAALIFVMTMLLIAAIISPRLRFVAAIDLILSPLLSPKLSICKSCKGHGKSHSQSKLLVMTMMVVFCAGGVEAASLRRINHEIGLDSVATESRSVDTTFNLNSQTSSTTLQGLEEEQNDVDSEVDRLHPGLLYKRDFSEITHGFTLRKHLMAPTTSDILGGIDNSSRLARNAIKLGIDNEMHRKLIGNTDRVRPLILNFDDSKPLPSKGPRVSVDDGISASALPFRDGPGVQAFFPEGTKELWSGDDANQPTLQMWEIVACPVMDVQGYLLDPFRCTFGIPDHGSQSEGSLVKFFNNLDGTETAIKFAMLEAFVPLAVEFVYNFSGLAFIEKMLRTVCTLVAGTIDSALDLISLGIYGLTASYSGASNTEDSVKDLKKDQKGNLQCPDDDRRLLGEELFPLSPNKKNGLSSIMDDPTSDDLIREAKMYALQLGLNEEESEEILLQIFDEQGNENKVINKDDLMESEQVREAKAYASKLGLKGGGADQVFSKLFDSLSDIDAPFKSKLEDKIEEDFSNPQNIAFIKSMLDKNIEENNDKYSRMLALQVVAGAIDKKTGQLNVEQLKETLSELQNFSNGSSRGLQDDDCKSNCCAKGGSKPIKEQLPLECGCNRAIDGVKDFVKEEIIKPVITTVADSLSSLDGFSSGGPLALAIDFADYIDPFSPQGPLRPILTVLIEKVFQPIVAQFIYDPPTEGKCTLDGKEIECVDLLPSRKNEEIQVKEDRDGNVYLGGGCSVDFRGELLWYQPVFKFVELFLGAVSDGIIEFFNIPVVILRLLFNAITSLFDHMGSVCSYLGGLIGYGGATYENTRYALQELACRDPSDIELQKGYGCDGLDNTCDDDKQIDECGEDIFPPEIDTTDAMLWCSNKIFPVPQDAIECFSSLVTAVDDCKDVELAVTASSITPGQAIIELKAVALGCGNRLEEDTTIIEIPVIIDEVELLRGYGCDGIDNNQNGFDNSITLDQAIDECAEDIFPPQIDASEAINQCANKIFDGATEAVDCFGAPGLVSAVDDCREVDIKIEEKEALDACTAVVGITAIALGCGNRALEDTTELDFPVPVDEVAPIVTCGFFPDTNSINLLDDKTLYHYKLKKDGGDNAQKQDARFFYTVTENCDADVQVDVVVESNEIQQNTVAQLFKRKRTGFQQQVKFFYDPSSCESKDEDGLCEVDLSMGYLKTRYYDITVTATDAAGHTGSDTCRVVIVPSCKSQDPGCEKYDKTVPYEKDAESYYYRISAVDTSVAQSEVLYEAAQQKLVWKSGLKTPQSPPNVPRSGKSAKGSDTAGGETKPWESDPTTSPTKSSQPSMTTLSSSQPSSSSRPKVKDITSPPSTSPTSAPTKPINCKKPEAKLDTKGNCKECCSGKCNRKKTKCQKVPIG